jgi:hypothetical protein
LSFLLALNFFKPVFQLMHTLQRQIPSPLQRFCHQPILRFHRVILSLCTISLVAGLREFQFNGAADLIGILDDLIGRMKGGLNGFRTQHAEHLSLDRLIDAVAAEGDTSILPMITQRSAAIISWNLTTAPRISDMDLAAAFAAK